MTVRNKPVSAAVTALVEVIRARPVTVQVAAHDLFAEFARTETAVEDESTLFIRDIYTAIAGLCAEVAAHETRAIRPRPRPGQHNRRSQTR